MHLFKIAAVCATFVAGSAGIASAQVNNCDNNAFAGTAIGAVVGGTTGGLIANNTRGFRGRSGFRSGFNRFGSRGFRGRRGNGALGAVIGAVVGGVAGNQIAAARQRNCLNNFRQQQVLAQQSHHSQQGYSGQQIDHNARRLGDPYGGKPVPQSHSTVYSHPAPQPQTYQTPQPQSYQTPGPHQTSIVTQPVVSSGEYCTRTDPHTHAYPTIHATPTSGTGYPSTTQQQGSFPITTQQGSINQSQPVIVQSAPLAGGWEPSCQVLDRRTTLPDGLIVTEPVEYCQYSPGGDWIPS